MIAAVATCTHYLADKRVECAIERADAAAGDHMTPSKLYMYYEQVYFHRQLVFWGRIHVAYHNVLSTLSTCCMPPEGQPSTCERFVVATKDILTSCGVAFAGGIYAIGSALTACWTKTLGLCAKKEENSDKHIETPKSSPTDDLESQISQAKEEVVMGAESTASEHGGKTYISVVQGDEVVDDEEQKEDVCSSHGGKIYACVVQDEDSGDSKEDMPQSSSHESATQGEEHVDAKDVTGKNIEDLD